MFRLLNSVIERYIRSFVEIIPEVTKNWFVIYKYAFYAGAVFIYVLTLLVLVTVVLIIFLIASPVSFIYNSLLGNQNK